MPHGRDHRPLVSPNPRFAGELVIADHGEAIAHDPNGAPPLGDRGGA
jgi:hypothetical protein